ncbi:MAG: dipicolinate synthase subunit B [Ruminococcus sp.]|nr:dipicolinate synthase subunit B [Ruminococcus sp.]
MEKLTYGYALTGSFCTFEKSIKQIENLVTIGINVIPIMSFNAYSIDTRFGTASSFVNKLEEITGNSVISTITAAEPIGPKKMCDLLIVSPCTGNTLGKLANGIYDTPVTLAVKSHLRNKRPVLIGVSSNDSLSASAKNIGQLLNYKHYYFIPMQQDDSINKPFSVVCDFNKTIEAAEFALKSEQMQPILL